VLDRLTATSTPMNPELWRDEAVERLLRRSLGPGVWPGLRTTCSSDPVMRVHKWSRVVYDVLGLTIIGIVTARRLRP